MEVKFVLGPIPAADDIVQIVTTDYEFCFHAMAMTRLVLPLQQQPIGTEVAMRTSDFY